jgi:PPP family 3-phenylpropionic acid transporter
MSFGLCLLVSVIHFSFREPLKPLLESLTLNFVNRDGHHYGRIRILGSIGFIITALLGGKLFEWGPVYPFISAYFICALLCVPLYSSLGSTVKSETDKPRSNVTSLNRKQLLFLGLIFLRSLSHAPLMLFLSIFLREELGVEFRWIGVYWLVAVLAEILLLYFYRNLFKREHCFMVMGFSLIATILRLFFMSQVEAPWEVFILQLLHAFTFASFYLASIDYVEHLFKGEQKTMGLSLVTSVSLGLSAIIGMNLCGVLEPYLGIRGLFLAASGIPFLAIALLLYLRSLEPGKFKPQNPAEHI